MIVIYIIVLRYFLSPGTFPGWFLPLGTFPGGFLSEGVFPGWFFSSSEKDDEGTGSCLIYIWFVSGPVLFIFMSYVL